MIRPAWTKKPMARVQTPEEGRELVKAFLRQKRRSKLRALALLERLSQSWGAWKPRERARFQQWKPMRTLARFIVSAWHPMSAKDAPVRRAFMQGWFKIATK
jgi:hypothetical protein